MIGDKYKFVKLKKEKYGSMNFSNDNFAKIIGNGTINLGSEVAQAENILLVGNMRHNLLSVS